VLAGAAAFSSSPVLAHTLHVPAEYPTIQYALIQASAGDTVLVAPGIRYENIVWPATPSLCLRSETGPATATIDGMGVSMVIRLATPVDSTTRIEGFTITHGVATEGGGIACFSAAPTIRGNWITGNTATWYGGGIYCEGTRVAPVIRDNRIIGNQVLDGSGGGICAYGDVFPVILDNELRDNHADAYYGGGVHCEAQGGYSGQMVIARNTLSGNSAYGGGALSIWNPYIDMPQVRDNAMSGNWASLGGAFYSFWSLSEVRHNVMRDNHADNAGGALLAEESHNLVVTDCEVTDNTAVSLGGGLALVNWTTTPLVADNRIQRNTAAAGGGIYCYMYSSPALRRNEILDNQATDRGGAIYCERLCAPTISDNVILHNHAPIAGGLLVQESQPTVTGCTFAGNGDTALRFRSGWTGHAAAVHENSIAGNAGYGIFNEDAAVPVAAENNWWGDATGPYHPTQNPGGLGDRVSDFVLFVPWLTDPGGVSAVGDDEIAAGLELRAGPRLTCAPNPFRASTTIAFQGPKAPDVTARVSIYDVTGRRLRTFTIPLLGGGAGGRILWSGDDDRGVPLPGGVHYVRFEAPGVSLGTKVLLLR